MLTEPSEGVPPLVTTPQALENAVTALRGGLGSVAMDAERAHGFRYSQRAYLIQLRRAGSGTHLIDPTAFGQPADLSVLGAAVSEAEWIIHAAGQDLPCLYEVGLVPKDSVRHRTRRTTARLSPGRVRHHDRRAVGGTAAEGALRFRLVQEAAA